MLTRLLSDLPIRVKFLLVPLIGALVIAVLGALFLEAMRDQQARLRDIARQDGAKMQAITRLFSAFSANHVAFISLLAASLRDEVEAGTFYARGREHIKAVNRSVAALDDVTTRFRLAGPRREMIEDLRERIVDYRDQMGETVLMSSVEIEKIAHFTLRANESYAAANEHYLSLVDNVLNAGLRTIVEMERELDERLLRFVLMLCLAVLVMTALSIGLSKLFSNDLRTTIRSMARLSEGDTEVRVARVDRRDEFGAVNRAMEVFREALIDRDAVEAHLKQEIQERAQAERSLRISEERFRALYEDNPLMLITVDDDDAVVSINRHGAQQLGREPRELVGTAVLETVIEEDRDRVARLLARCRAGSGSMNQWTVRRTRKDGELLWLRETGREIRERDRKLVLLACEDITETQRLTEQLSHQARHDALTGLVNRWEFERRLNRVVETARKTRSEHILCYLDLDQFKVINDTCGHSAGDKLLRELGRALETRVRTRDTLARLGGDEFGVLLEHCSLSHGWRAARELLKVVSDFRFQWQDREFRLGVSIGMVPIDGTSEDITQLLADADTACYAAKDEGRNRVHVFQADDQQLVRRRGDMLWASRIPQALEDGRFQLFYQDIAALNAPHLPGRHVELLIRMLDEVDTPVMPGVFLPAAERYGLSSRLDRWVVSTALAALARCQRRADRVSLCAINLSGQSLGEEDFADFVLQELADSGVTPATICFEITETAAITNLSRARDFIVRLKERGASFALDDFGTGVSSFAYLRELPVDYLKIDGVFVRDIDKDAIALAMVRSIHEIGKVMGMRTIAEFVESEAIVAHLADIGIDYAQGYHIGRPRPAAEIFNGGQRTRDG